MNNITINRYYQDVTGKAIREQIIWAKVNDNDPRAVPLGGQVGMWLPTSICSSPRDIPEQLYGPSQEEVMITDDDGVVSSRPIRGELIGFVPLDIYNQPLPMGMAEITMAQYNAIMQS